ncbi:NAD-P-binding protein [Vararia minispora EC-137]|uniref:NAD-P-binding protein n=1 Tax=Vararia minispora EC-137 TaxID=1314806 RepID=A0ACB8QSR6_9AGAM|nr:NAD-P-binding protein [Vararia minispora EC-137]
MPKQSEFLGITDIIGLDEDLPVHRHHDVYPTIDPSAAFAQKTFAGQVVLVSGASRGIGREAARFYARAGAATALVARTESALQETRALILDEMPDAQVLVLTADVKDHVAVAKAVEATVARFGRLDILIANAGTTSAFNPLITEKDPDEWWDTVEVNVRGVFNLVRAGLPHLKGGHGRVVITTSSGAQIRLPGSSDYNLSKHTLLRLTELIALEFPDVRVFAMHPGAVKTEIVKKAAFGPEVYEAIFQDSVQLGPATMLYLTAGKADYLSGRYMSANWDLAEVERDWKDKIVSEHGLVSKLYIP